LIPGRRSARWFVLFVAIVLPALAWCEQDRGPDRAARLRAVQRRITRLESELGQLKTREKGVLSQLNRIDAEIILRESQLRETGLRLETISEMIAVQEARADELEAVQVKREGYLSFRLREMYKQGPGKEFQRVLLTDDAEKFLAGLRYASYLSERDARIMQAYRIDAGKLQEELAVLAAEKKRQSSVLAEASSARAGLQAGRSSRGKMLTRLRADSSMRKTALRELQDAADDLSTLVSDLAVETELVDMAKFHGLLDLPVDGAITAGFGEIVHPRFKTRVPHPGLDIEAAQGEKIRSVFDGTVLFAAWLRGYGLTVILTHGSGLVSIYSHASVLLAEKGEVVLQGQTIAQVGETGSLKGPYLYFELRSDGKAVDPVPWFRKD
jgi:septal ring factor EnvC (AmiA/AmiB activator)